ncbi:MAG: hypothetical protein IPI35_35180 [Deltaproteobacteria bacterium]|jgi:hypothetical protein|nr:hypothetical protein [Deltaproteobacteria bacterium]
MEGLVVALLVSIVALVVVVVWLGVQLREHEQEHNVTLAQLQEAHQHNAELLAQVDESSQQRHELISRLEGHQRERDVMSANLGEQERQVLDLRAQVTHLKSRSAQVENQLSEYRTANRDFDAQNADLKRELAHISRINMELAKQAVPLRIHTVFMDGMSKGGKTTLMERLTNPTATPQDLDSIQSTMAQYRTSPVPLCWGEENGVRVLHAVDFVDIAGGSPEQIGNMIDRHHKENKGRAVALMIWDVCVGIAKNAEYISEVRLRATYERDVAREVVSSIVVFFNKVDKLPDMPPQGPEADPAMLELRQHVDLLLQKSFNPRRDSWYVFGSARSGAGVHECLGAIVCGLELDHLFTGSTEVYGSSDR